MREILVEVLSDDDGGLLPMMNGAEQDDGDLLERMLDGDETSFTELYRRRQAAVYRFALQMTGETAIAEDVTQEVFLALIKHGRKFDPARGTLASFLFGIARNMLRRRLDRNRTSKLETSEGEAAIENLAGGGDVLEDLARRETVDQVRRAVLSLPPLYREVVALCDLEDCSYEEAAGTIECPVGTVRSRLNRARGMLAQEEKLGSGHPIAAAARGGARNIQ